MAARNVFEPAEPFLPSSIFERHHGHDEILCEHRQDEQNQAADAEREHAQAEFHRRLPVDEPESDVMVRIQGHQRYKKAQDQQCPSHKQDQQLKKKELPPIGIPATPSRTDARISMEDRVEKNEPEYGPDVDEDKGEYEHHEDNCYGQLENVVRREPRHVPWERWMCVSSRTCFRRAWDVPMKSTTAADLRRKKPEKRNPPPEAEAERLEHLLNGMTECRRNRLGGRKYRHGLLLGSWGKIRA